MEMDGDIRVRTDKAHSQLYKDYKRHFGKDAHELFFLATCIGFQQDRHEPLVKKMAEDRFWSKTITPDEWATYYSMMLQRSDMDYDAVQDDSTTIQVIEGYANGGLIFLLDEILTGYIISKEDLLTFDPQVADELPRRILQFMYENAKK